ncbi:MAG: outer membrane beta-barrel protein [Pseudomonadota bacterium]
MRTRPLHLVAAITISPLCASAAIAQEDFFTRDRYVAVKDRQQPEFDPVEGRVGSFRFQPELALSGNYISNVFATEDNEVDDFALGLAPRVSFQSDWSRHEVGGVVSVDHREYIDVDSETRTNYRASANSRIDVTRKFDVGLNARYEDLAEPRSAAEATQGSVEPVDYEITGLGASANYETGRVRISGELTASEADYDDVRLVSGVLADQDFRDREELDGRLRFAYAPARDWAVFTQFVGRDSDGTTTFGPGGVNRDFETTAYQVGVDFELASLLRGDVAVGFENAEFADPGAADEEGLSIDGQVEWFATQLTTVAARAYRRTEAGGLVDSAGRTVGAFEVGVDYELRRNIILSADANFANFDFLQTDREDDRMILSASAAYKLNKNAHVEVGYQLIDQNSSGLAADADFTDNSVFLGIRLYP